MTAQLRAELLKQRSTRTNLGLLAALFLLVLLVALLHGLALPAKDLGAYSDQLQVFDPGEMLGTLFAALLGALSITSEFRHGTIRPTFLATPRRALVVAAKVTASLLIGIVFGLIATGVAAGIASAALATRGLEIQLDGGDYAQLLAGGAAAAALWAAIGVGLGALVRHQVPTVVGLCAWLLFIEGLLGDFSAGGIASVSRYGPGALGKAASGLATSPGPALALLLLALYAAAAATLGVLATIRRDVA